MTKYIIEEEELKGLLETCFRYDLLLELGLEDWAEHCEVNGGMEQEEMDIRLREFEKLPEASTESGNSKAGECIDKTAETEEFAEDELYSF